jgi:hypothetical protein
MTAGDIVIDKSGAHGAKHVNDTPKPTMRQKGSPACPSAFLKAWR